MMFSKKNLITFIIFLINNYKFHTAYNRKMLLRNSATPSFTVWRLIPVNYLFMLIYIINNGTSRSPKKVDYKPNPMIISQC